MDRTHSASTAASTFSVALLAVSLITAFIDPSRLLLLLIPASFLLASHGAGLLWERAMQAWTVPLPAHLPMLRLAARLGTGISLVGLSTTLLGQVGFYQAAGALLLLALGWNLVNMARNPPSFQAFRPSIASAIGGTGIGAVWAIVWLWATIPPTFYDELAYHLPIAQQALRTGTIPATPWLFFTYMPHLSDLLLGWGLALAGDIGARAMHVTFWIAIWIAGWALIEAVSGEEANPWTGVAVAGVLSSSATFLFMGTLTFAETALTFGVVTSAALIVTPSLSHAWLPVGLIWGFILSVKLSGVSWVAATAVSVLVLGWSISSVSKAIAITCMTTLPWWGRAWWLTGNPLYPFGYRWLGGHYWDDTSEARLRGDLPSFAGFSDPLALLRLPYDMVMSPGQFGSASECGPLAVVSVCLLLLLPLWTLSTNLDQTVRRQCYAAGLFVLLTGISWLLTSITTRFYAPALVLGLCSVAALTMKAPKAYLAASLVFLAGLGVWGTSRFLSVHSLAFSAEKAALAQEAGPEFAMRTLDHYSAAKFARENLPSEATILFIGESRPFHFDRPALAPYPYHQHPLAQWVMDSATPEDLRDRIRREGFTHVVLNIKEFRRLRQQYSQLAFVGPAAALHEQRLKLLPQTLVTLYAQNGLYIFEVPSGAR